MTSSSTGTQVLTGGPDLPPQPDRPVPARSRYSAGPSATAVVAVLVAALVGGALTGWALRGTGAAATRGGGQHAAGATGTVIRVQPSQVSLADITGQDDPGGVGAAVDGNPATAWSTEWYTSPTFGNLKVGVGLVVDLGRPTAVRAVRLLMSAPGTGVAVYAGNAWSGGGTPAGLTPVTASATVGAAATLPVRSVTARYWLVWLDQLPATSNGYRSGIAEMSFLS